MAEARETTPLIEPTKLENSKLVTSSNYQPKATQAIQNVENDDIMVYPVGHTEVVHVEPAYDGQSVSSNNSLFNKSFLTSDRSMLANSTR